MILAILGTRGIPNHHGGFEQFAENFSVYLADLGHEVYVYNSHDHPYRESEYKGVRILHKNDPENRLGTFGQFIYDFNCILDSRSRKFDVILQLGYTSSSVWGWLLPRKPIIVTNMDGLEWKRSKYSVPVRRFLKYAEKLAIASSDYLISDSLGIQDYLRDEYGKDSEFIAYGADPFYDPDETILNRFGVSPEGFNMLIARLEPENNIQTILDGVVESQTKIPFLIIGKHETQFGAYLKSRYNKYAHIVFLGGIYDLEILNNLRYFSNLYFHGHSVGGTNPSLLEAMASKALIIAHDNVFNKAILEEDAFYFSTSTQVARIMDHHKRDFGAMVANNFSKIRNQYSWDLINQLYERYLMGLVNQK